MHSWRSQFTPAPIILRSMPEVFVLPHLCFSCSKLAFRSCCPIHSKYHRGMGSQRLAGIHRGSCGDGGGDGNSAAMRLSPKRTSQQHWAGRTASGQRVGLAVC
ncbi:hypothetical protein F441_21259 [Phytophthora nicotianae CJ01A1]|uniref:Uncharacterized protein n=3 Tax=Phytophthora nicotianae TaxID=4792 RepID=V9DXX8_PHYNI|nr:hypothetical protein F443_21361 [Phytophthora nicotianae P1569]ETP01499.1 hypothetical protein F441_21259 [Phytophthora nicotianae CJ01A1]